MLALLWARRGDLNGALAILHQQAPRLQDAMAHAQLAQALAVTLVMLDLTDAAARLAQRLLDQPSVQTHGRDDARDWLVTLQLADAHIRAAQGQHRLLARELRERLEVLPALVAAQQLTPHRDQIEQLREAVRWLDHDADFSLEASGQGLAVCQAMAQLALLAQDADDARAWAHRGLKLEPMSAALALVLAQVGDDAAGHSEPAAAPSALAVLERVAQAHPDYRDIKAALIRRAFAEGHNDQAHQRLTDWLHHDPLDPTARQLQQDLAA
jgi:hypothetical protein